MIRFLFLFLISALQAENWPQFRGRNASGLSPEKPTVTSWDVEKGTNVLFHKEVPGVAHSSPIVFGDRVYLTTAVAPSDPEVKLGLYGDIDSAPKDPKQKWRILAFDKKSGELIYNKLGYEAVPRNQRHPKATQCNSTPATDGKFIVAYFGSEGIFCFNMEGTLQWKKDLGEMNSGFFKMPTAQWGFASSPIIHEGKAVILCDVQKNSFVGVIDLASGDWEWKKERADVPTWSTPSLAKVAGTTQILVNGWRHSGAYDFETGKEIWKLSGGGDIPVPTPVVGKKFAYFTSAHGRFRPMRAIRLSAEGDITPPAVKEVNEHIPWVHHRFGNYMQTPLLAGKYLYGCNDRGALTCFNAHDGTILFSERLPASGFSASLVSDGRHLYVSSEFGEVWVVKVGPKYEEVGQFELGGNCMATPAISEGVIYYRAQKSLIALGVNELKNTPASE